MSAANPALAQFLGAGFAQLANHASMFCTAHLHAASNPLANPSCPNNLRRAIEDVCLNRPEWAMLVLNDPANRHAVYARMIYVYIDQNILKVEAFNGYDREFDMTIDAIKALNFNLKPPVLRLSALTSIKLAFEGIRHRENFKTFLAARVKYHCEQLWTILKHLFGRKTAADFPDLKQIIEEAFELTQQLFLNPGRYFFVYPSYGDVFKDETMKNVARKYLHIDGKTMERQKFKVAYAITPYVEMRTYNKKGFICTVTIAKANVMAMK
jgi:hypothetical protein